MQHGFIKTLTLLSMTLATAIAQGEDDLWLPPVPVERVAPPSPHLTLTIEDLQQLAIENNPTLEQARAITWKALGRHVQAGKYPNPTIAYSAGEVAQDGEAGQQGFYIQQQFVTAGKLEKSQAVAVQTRRQAEQALTMQELRVSNGVRREYYKLLAAKRLRRLADELVSIAEEGKRITQHQLDLKEATRIDLLQAQLEVENAELFRIATEKRTTASRRSLATVVGIATLPAGDIAGDLEQKIPNLDWEQTRQWLVEQSPQLERARFGAERARAALERAKVQPIPNITIQAGSQYDFATRTQIANVQASMPIPFFNRNQGNIKTAESEWIRAYREIDRIELSLKRSLATAFQNYQTQTARVARLKERILPMARETLKLTQIAYDAGEIGYLQLLAVQTRFTRIDRDYVESLAALWQSVIVIDSLLLNDALAAPIDIQ